MVVDLRGQVLALVVWLELVQGQAFVARFVDLLAEGCLFVGLAAALVGACCCC